MNKETINILFFKDINIIFKNRSFDFFCTEIDNNTYKIENIPLFFNSNSFNLFNCLAYDYDKLPNEIKEKYKFYYKSLVKDKDNIYKVNTKTYKIKKNNH